MPEFSLADIAKQFDAKLVGDGKIVVDKLSGLNQASTGTISYITDKNYLKDLAKTQADCVIIAPEFSQYYQGNALISNNVMLLVAKLSHLFTKAPQPNIHPSAVIDPSAILSDTCVIGACCVIGQGVKIGSHTQIKANTTIEQGVVIGDNNLIDSGVVIGSEGFGNAVDEQGRWHSIKHFGGVIIGDDVHIGANTVIDRGRFDNTHIHTGVHLDNLIHIAHNVEIGQHTVIAAGTKIAGSTHIGKHCQIAGMVGIENQLSIADGVVIYSGSIVRQNIKTSGEYNGSMPVLGQKQWLKAQSTIKKLDKIRLNFKD